MHTNNSIQLVISDVIAIHKELEVDAHAVGVHRKELGARIDSINKRYLKLFERVMSELLAMQRNKFTSLAEELEKMREAVRSEIIRSSISYVFFHMKYLYVMFQAEELLDKLLAGDTAR